MTDKQTLRIVVTQEDGVYIAQCLEYDICTQAPTLDELKDRMNCLIDCEVSEMKTRSQLIDPAPERFHNMWDQMSKIADGGHEYRMSAAA